MLSLFHSFATQMQPIMTPSPTTTTTLDSTNSAMPAGVVFTYLIIVGLLLVLAIVCTWVIFNKLGDKGWKSLIPIYSQWTFLKLGDKPGWWAILALIPVVNIVAAIFVAIAAYNIGLKLHKPGWYVVLYLLVSPIWYIILAFSKDASAQEPVDSANFVSGATMTPPPFAPTAPVATPNAPEQPSDTPTRPTPPTQF